MGPGSHTIVFRVKNAESSPGIERSVNIFGTGRVWLDDCAVSSTGKLDPNNNRPNNNSSSPVEPNLPTPTNANHTSELSSNTTTTNTTSSNQPAVITKADYWWAVRLGEDANYSTCIYDANYPEQYLQSFVYGESLVLFDTEEECCGAYSDCQLSTPTNGLLGKADPSNSSLGEYWYPAMVDSLPKCIFGASYPFEYATNVDIAATFLFDTQKLCCEAFPISCPHMFWYPNKERSACLWGDEYLLESEDNLGETLFVEEKQCCDHWGCDGEANQTMTDTGECQIHSGAFLTICGLFNNLRGSLCPLFHPSTVSTISPPIEPYSPPDSCAYCVWHESDSVPQTCTNSPSYPPAWDEYPESRAHFFFRNAEDCCNTRFLSECIIEDVFSNEETGEKEEGNSKWHESITDPQTCTNSPSYPPAWDKYPESRAHFFFQNAEECCNTRFLEECNVVDVLSDEEPGENEKGLDSCTECTWHESITDGQTCTNSPSYPPAWDEYPESRAYLFFQNAEDCCNMRFPEECNVVDVLSDEEPEENEKGLDSCTECTWHESITDGQTCTNSSSYPPAWDEYPELRAHFFFQNAEDCCNVRFPEECYVVDVSSEGTKEKKKDLDSCIECTWHESITDPQTCTNSLSYPPVWDEQPGARAYFFFKTANDCCSARFPEDCDVVDVDAQGTVSAEDDFINLGPVTIDDFSGPDLILPFDVGSPPQWELEVGSQSLTNIPVDGLSATADLTLRFHVDSPSRLSCTVHVNTSMPFDMFMLMVNGDQQKTYYMGHQELVTVSTGFGPGKHTVVFRVMNSQFDPPEMDRVINQFGTGRVRLHDCEISSVLDFVTEKSKLSTKGEPALVTRAVAINNSLVNDSTGEDEEGNSTNPGFTHLSETTVDDFDRPDPVLPFDLGFPPQWELEANMQALTNIPTVGLNATADLILRIHVDTPSTIRCTARIDTSMPFERFMLIVNEEQRNLYPRVHRGLAIVETSISTGNNTILFRVMNTGFITELEREDGNFGSGRVWLDECRLIV